VGLLYLAANIGCVTHFNG